MYFKVNIIWKRTY